MSNKMMSGKQRVANLAADEVLRSAGLPTYSELRALLDEAELGLLSIALANSAIMVSGLSEKIVAAVPNYSAVARYAS